MSPHQSFWLANLKRPTLTAVTDLPQSVDVVVIGSGLTGVSTAYWLSTQGIKTLLLEKSELSSGATGRNGGHIIANSGPNFATSIQQHGIDGATAILEFTRENFRLLHELVEGNAINCDLRDNDLVTLAMNAQQTEQLQQAYDLMTTHGLATDFWDAAQVARRTSSHAFYAAIVRPGHGQFWPAKLVVALAQLAVQQGALMAPHTSVKRVDRQSDGLIVSTDRGDVRAAAVVYATNALSHHLLPELKDVIQPVLGQALATAPLPRLWDFDWSANDGYEYAIQRADGRIIFGGMRWCSPSQEVGLEDDTTIELSVSQGLRSFLREHFEALRDIKIDYEWTGIMGFTPDEQPLIGELPHRPGEYIAAGFTGQGMSLGFLAGKVLADLIARRGDISLPAAFAPERFN